MTLRARAVPVDLATVGWRFVLVRLDDVHHKSGTGEVAAGWQMPSGRVIMEWNSSIPSFTCFMNIQELLQVHGHAGRTIVRWVDRPPDE